MAESGTGIVFTQSGVPVQGSADYQRVFDSRWRFVEIEFERTFTVNLPAVPAVGFAARYDEVTPIIRHGLGFVPMFETDFVDQQYNYALLSSASMYADDQYLFFSRLINTQGAEAQSLTFTVRLYNLPILIDYTAPKGLPQGTQSPRSNIGVKFLDRQTPGVDVGDNAVKGFSVDTTKKILSIHKHGLAKINDWVNRYLQVTAINTTTDVFTYGPSPGASGAAAIDLAWAQTAGTPIIYTPQDYATLPGGMPSQSGGVNSITLYIIPVDSSHFKVASSYDNALAGIAIDITSTGALPGSVNGTNFPGDNSNAILHDVGYPPTFLIAPLTRERIVAGSTTLVAPFIGALMDIIVASVTADNRYIYFKGIQAVFGGWYGYVILKDPAELAR